MQAVIATHVNKSSRTQVAILALQNQEARRKIGSMEKQLKDAHAEIGMLTDELRGMQNLVENIRLEKEQKQRCVESDGQESFRLSYIEAWVCRLHGVSKSEMRSSYRDRRIVHARSAFYYWARVLTPKSFPAIGLYVGKDHTTIMNGYQRYQDNRQTDRNAMRKLRPKTKTRWWIT